MALPTIENVTNQMLNESVRQQPTVAMKGNVTRPMIIGDLLRAMNDVNFKDLVEEYGSMVGIKSANTTPMTNSLMQESPRVPSTPTVSPTPMQTTQNFTAPEVPTPMTNAKENPGIMSNTTQQIA
tara:strand:- start:12 stop:386 length:375 start_codon:yes stop_codon:yes gene_type:complete